MLYTPHFLTGAAILKVIPNPALGLPLALLSHVLLDLTPHHDFDITPGVTLSDIFKIEKKKKYFMLTILFLDFIVLLWAVGWVLFTGNNMWLLGGGIMGILPDAVEQGLVLLLGKTLPGWQDRLQWRVPAKYGFISYPIVSLIAIYILIK